jgi:hypothetical protein
MLATVESALPRAMRLALIVCLLGSACGDDGGQSPAANSQQDAGSHEPSGPDAGELTSDAAGELDAGDGIAPSEAGAADSGLGRDGDAGDGAGRDDAGSDAAAPDTDAPLLVASTPDDGDDNVASAVAPELVFSEAVAFTADALRIRQAHPARTLAFSATLSADQRSIELALDEVPELPAELTIEIGDGISDLAGNPLAPTTVHFTVPIWLRLGAANNRDALATASDVLIALDGEARPVLLAVEGGDVYASRWQGAAFAPLGAALNQQPALASAAVEPRVALMIDASGAPIAAFRESSGVRVVRWDGTSFQPLGDTVDPEAGGSYAPALAPGASGEPIVAFDALDGSAQPVLRVRAFTGASWQTLASVSAETRGVRLAGDGQSDFTIAYQQTGAGVLALRWNGSALVPLGPGAALAAGSTGFALSVDGTANSALTAQGQRTVRLDAGAWQGVPHDLGFANGSAAFDRVLAHAPDDALLTAFAETPVGESASRVYVQRLDGARFQPLGAALNRDRRALASRPALAVAAQGQPLVAFLETPASGLPRIFVSQFNGDPAQPPTGLRERAYSAACLASAPADGSTLIDTGCFADATGREPVPGFIPFDVISPLWSDGAFKRRFFMLPEGETISYRDPGIWTFPAGTILMKEFAIEARRGDPGTIRPVETRFLIVRATGDWDRYSYQWNQDASQAVLRAATPATPTVDFAIEDEGGTAATQTHFYPNRAQCLSCHETPGTVLGPQTVMLNRNFDYGSTVDNQVRSMQQLGIFGASFPAGGLQTMGSMPNPSDTSYSTEARLRAYLHANCSGCHHPLQALDLRVQVPTLDSGLCSKITKGTLDTSVLYQRDVLRGYQGQPGVAPMPPLGTLVSNPLLEPLISDWILDPQNPCP